MPGNSWNDKDEKVQLVYRDSAAITAVSSRDVVSDSNSCNFNY